MACFLTILVLSGLGMRIGEDAPPLREQELGLQRRKTMLDLLGAMNRKQGSETNFSQECDRLSADSSADSHGLLAWLFLFGFPDQRGEMKFPHGVPRNMSR